MDTQALYFGFINYLQTKEPSSTGSSEDGSDYSDLSEISLFMKKSVELKEYIEQEYDYEGSLDSLSVMDILNLEVVNGKLVDPSANEDETSAENNDTNYENYEQINSEYDSLLGSDSGQISDLDLGLEDYNLVNDYNSLLETDEIYISSTQSGNNSAESSVEEVNLSQTKPVLNEDSGLSDSDNSSEGKNKSANEISAKATDEEKVGDTSKDKTDKKTVGEYLKNFFDNEDTFNKIDKDKNGELNKEELSALIENLAKADGDYTNLSIEDLLKAEDIEDFFNSDKTEDNKDKQLDEKSLGALFNKLLEDENFVKAIDTDGNGEFSKEELAKFFDSISEYDKNKTNVSVDDIQGAADDIKAHTPSVENSATESSPSASGPSGYTGGYSGVSGNTIQQPQEKTLDNMTKEELNSELTKAESELSENQTKLSDMISGKSEELTKLQENIDETYEAYQEELEKVDKDMAKQVDDLQSDINDKETEVSDKEQEIADQESEVSDCETAYDNAVTYRKALESQLSELKSASSDASGDDKAEIDAQISIVEGQIEEAKKREDDAEEALDKAKDKLSDLKDEKEVLDGELEDLNTKMTELQESILEKYPEIEEYMTAYNDAKKAFETEQTRGINEAKSAVEKSQKYVNEVKTALNNCDIKDKEKENLSVISPFAKYNEERGKSLAEAALSLYGNDHVANGRCAGGVSNSIYKAFGYRTYGNGCDYGGVLAERSDWVEVTSEITSVDQLKSLPAGAIVSWSTYEAGHTASNGRYGHVFISDGQGHEISDYIGDINTNFASWGASYRVFIPC